VATIPYGMTFLLVTLTAHAIAWGEGRRLRQEQRHAAELQQQLQNAYERIQAAYDVAVTLRTTMSYERVLEAILTELARFVDFSVGLVLLFGGQGSELRVVASKGLIPRDAERVLRANIGGAIGRVLDGAEILTVQEPGRDPGLGQFAALQDARTTLCLPLRAGFELFGIVVIASTETCTHSPEQLKLLEGMSNQAVIALQNSMLYQSLREERDRIIDAEEDARRQLARDLHDGPAQGLAAIVMKADFIRRLLDRDPGRVPDELLTLEDIAKRTTKEVRTLLFQLRPVSLETQGLVPTLQQYAEKLNETDALNLIVEAEELPALDPNISATIFTIIQEAVNNAKKHAGTPDIWLRLGVRGENLLVEVEDHGKGFDVAALEASYDTRGSLGMLNMRERAERIGGVFSIQSAPGQGTLITVAVPLTS
jgi:signal transduction histidine kinase